MVKKLYLIRHGQGEHNISEKQPFGNSLVKDPLLTPTGVRQCLDLRSRFPFDEHEIDIVMASPLRRTIQTAVIGLNPALQKTPHVPFLLVPDAQEISYKPCDIGTDPAALKTVLPQILQGEEFGGFDAERVDFGILEEGWNSKAGKYEASLDATKKRADALRRWLFARPEENIALVSHGAFIHYLTEDWTGLVPIPETGRLPGTAWKTCEFRIFTFDEGSNETEAHITQVGKVGDKGTRPVGAHAHDITGTEERATEPLPN